MTTNKLVEVKKLKVYFPLKNGLFKKSGKVFAVDDVSFEVYQGEILGIVGESGCGKSSLARSLVGLNKITSGDIIFMGQENLSTIDDNMWHKVRKDIQFIFQDPVASLNPRMNIMEIISEPLNVYYPNLSSEQAYKKVLVMAQLVGLSERQLNCYPQELSGGQCQRVGIARSLILEPKLIICDESVSALDASIKAQIINLIKDLQVKLNLTVVFISHDLSIIKYICDRVLVMYLGNIMELSTTDIIFENHYHPYTQALLSAVPIANPKLEKEKSIRLLQGDLPSPTNPPSGCVFSTRCPIVDDNCRKSKPALRSINGSRVACFKV